MLGPDLATGHGLTDAYRATMLALMYGLVGRRVVPRAPLEAPLENEGWERDYDVTEPTEPTFDEPPA